MSIPAEPAIKSYFFGKGYSDLRNTIRDSWRLNMASASDYAKEVAFDKGWDEAFKSALSLAAAFSVVVFGTAFFLLASLVHISVLLSFFLLIYISFTLVYLAERISLFVRGFSTYCPNCHHKTHLPEYYCDNPKGCKNLHRRLTPSSYGIFRHTCKCGQKLPATFFLNRGRLQARCPGCEKLLPRETTESRKRFIAIVGGPSVGKSSYLYSVIWRLIEEKLPSLGLTHSFIEARNQHDYDRVCKSMEAGRPPDKTAEKLPSAFNIMISKGRLMKRLLYLYDPAGEAYATADDLVTHKYQEYLSGCVFLVDPFSIPYVRQTYDTELRSNVGAIKPGPYMLEDTLSRFLLSMEEHYGLSKTKRISFPVAVVINKTDAFDLDDQIGETAIDRYMKSSPTALDYSTARDQILRGKLQQWGQSGFVQQLEQRFAKVKYFPCSALGKLPQGRAQEFEPKGVLDPLMWILGESDRRIVREAPSSLPVLQGVADILIEWRRAAAFLVVLCAMGISTFLLWPSASASNNLEVVLKPNKTAITKGEPVLLSAQIGGSPSGSLSYAWQSSQGKIEGSGAEVRLNTNGLDVLNKDLAIEVSVVVSDATGAKGSARQNVLVQAPPATLPPVASQTPVPSTAVLEEIAPPSQELSLPGESSPSQVANLLIATDADGVQVSVDGSPRGTFSTRGRLLRLPPGRHVISASKSGYKTYEESIDAAANKRVKMLIRLERSEPTPQERALEYLTRADQLFQQRQYDAAIAACNDGLRLAPGNQTLLAKRASIERAKEILNRPTAQASQEPSRDSDSADRSPSTRPESSSERFEPAVVTRRVTPSYPQLAKSARVAGSVTVQITVDEYGNVSSARAIQGPALLHQAAVEAAKQWKFRPARRGGQTVSETKTIAFNFTL